MKYECPLTDIHRAMIYSKTKLVCEEIERGDAKTQRNILEKAKGHGANATLCALCFLKKINSALLRLCVCSKKPHHFSQTMLG